MDKETNKYLAEEYNREAKALYYKSDNAGAVRFLVKALSVDPLNDVTISALTFYCLRPKEEAIKANITFETIKTTAEAMHGMVSKYRKTRTLSSKTFNTCAMLYRRIRNRRMCFYYYSLAWRAEPDDPSYPVQMADILLSEQSYGAAAMLCYHALKIDPTYADAYYIKGMIEIIEKRSHAYFRILFVLHYKINTGRERYFFYAIVSISPILDLHQGFYSGFMPYSYMKNEIMA
jgi:tetratricopeptide (TPR) repeat protein